MAFDIPPTQFPISSLPQAGTQADPSLAFPDIPSSALGGSLFTAAKALQNGYQNAIAPSAYTGTSPLADFLPSLPRNKWEALLQLAPVAAMIPTSRNLPTFLKQLSVTLGRRGYHLSPSLLPEALIQDRLPAGATAKAYMDVRYPQRMSVPKDFQEAKTALQSSSGNDLAGAYSPSKNTVYYFANANDPEGVTTNVVNTLAHETNHAIDTRRLMHRDGTPNYSNLLKVQRDNLLPYAQKDKEIRANRAGETAEKGFQSFLDLLAKTRLSK